MAEVIEITLSDAQVKACEMMGAELATVAISSVASAIKGKLNYYRNGATCDASQSTHSLVKVRKDGSKKTVYYKGGLKEGAEKAYEMAKSFLPADVSKAMFVNNALAEVDAILAALNGVDDKDGPGYDVLDESEE